MKTPILAPTNMTQATSIAGKPVVTLTRPRPRNENQAHLLEAVLLPGRGMSLLQVKAFLPGKGEIGLIDAPPLAEAKRILEQEDDEWGNKIFGISGAILLPYPNRITGTVSADGKNIQAVVAGKPVSLPANWRGKKPGAQVVSIHGLLARAQFEDVRQQDDGAESRASASYRAGDFGGRWLSQTNIKVEAQLRDIAFEMQVEATNVGKELLPMSVAFHPGFVFPSGERAQARLHVPAMQRALVNNYDDVLPTGQIEDVKGTPYDFTAPGGKALGTQFLDDTFTTLQRGEDGSASVEIIDPAAHYGLRIAALSPEIQAIQIYAPLGKNFVAVEPQFNLVDPYNKIWGSRNTGMAHLQPGESVCWRVRLELFTPSD
jgi:galactose mutarotase-like enzyme